MRILLAVFLVGIVAVNCVPQRKPPGPGGKGKNGQGPCRKWTNVESCTCKDGSKYSTKDDLKTNCKHWKGNPIETCSCKDESTWTPPPRPVRPAKPPKPCGNGRNIQECTCSDEKTYTVPKEIRTICKHKTNPITSCTCKDGTPWDKSSKDKSSEDESSEDQSEESE